MLCVQTTTMNADIEFRNICRLCNSPDLKAEVTLPNVEVADRYHTNPNTSPVKYPIDLYRCNSCGHVQILSLVPLDILFASDYTYKPSNNRLLIEHFDKYAKSLARYCEGSISKSLDIGCNDGLFLEMIKRHSNARVIGIDPSEGPLREAHKKNIETIQDFFNSKTADSIKEEYGQFDHISANNVFAHNDDLRGFALGVSKLLRRGGLFTFEISYLVDIVEKTMIGTIFHEHLSHHALTPLISFLKEFDLHLVHANRVDTQGGALIGYALKGVDKKRSDDLLELLSDEDKKGVVNASYMEFFRKNIITIKSEFQRNLNALSNKGYEFIGFGAARSANLLVEFFQLREYLDLVFDDNEAKIGKYLSNSDIKIKKTDFSMISENTVIIPLAWIHTSMIVDKLSNNSIKCKVLTLYPRVDIVDCN